MSHRNGPLRTRATACYRSVYSTCRSNDATSNTPDAASITGRTKTAFGPVPSYLVRDSPEHTVIVRIMPTIRDVAAVLEAWAPPASAQSYDNVGLQIGDASVRVTRGLIALDLTPEVLEEASRQEVDIVITHHPLIFRPIRRVVTSDAQSHLIYQMASRGIALYSIHTNLDAAYGGVSFGLASQLGLTNVHFLDELSGSLKKLVVFVPLEHVDVVRNAMADAGAGRIGAYDSCAFAHPGTGYFRPGEAASPFIGSSGGRLERVEEMRIEVEVPGWRLADVLAAVRESHPYEEVAYDVYATERSYSRAGLGTIGLLPERMPLSRFLAHVSERLGTPSLRYTGDPDMPIERVAVCGGSGSDLIATARSQGADAYVTADVTYHKFFEVLDSSGQCRMALIDPGHYETEAVAEQLLHAYLTEHLPETTWIVTSSTTNPVRYFHPES